MKENIRALSGACTLVGAIVGAGFLSGREIYVYFSRFGEGAYLGILIAIALFAFAFYHVMCFCREREITSVKELCLAGLGRAAGNVAYIFLLGGAVVTCASMISCTNAFCIELLGWSHFWGGAFTALLGLVVVMLGMKSIRLASTVLIPVILIFLLAVSAVYKGVPQGIRGDMRLALLSGVVFMLYNSALSFGVLLGVSKSPAQKTVAIASVAIVLLMLLLNRLMQTLPSDVEEYELPFAAALVSMPKAYTYLYALVLWSAIFTTYISAIYCFSTLWKPLRQTLLYSGVTVVAFAISLIGFSNIVAYVYPVSAVSGLVLLAGIVYKRMKYNEINCRDHLCHGKSDPDRAAEAGHSGQLH